MATKSGDLPFVGRQTELGKFREMLDSRDAPWLMWVIGPAGQGKSKFLEACLNECENRRLVHSRIIDFFSDNLRTRIGILKDLIARFGLKDKALLASIKKYDNEVLRGEDAEESVLNLALSELEDNLIHVLQRKRRTPIVILVDTVEEITEGLGSWYFEKFLSKLYPHICVVAAGRRIPLAHNKLKKKPGNKAYYINLKPLSEKDVKSYLEQTGISLRSDTFTAFYRLTYREKGDSQPLLVGLAAKALNDGVLSEDDLLKISAKEFEERLVIEPHRSDTIENSIILQLAHAYHGYTPDILSNIYPLERLEAKSYTQFLNELKRFPYVKHYSDTETTRLHDYFRERLIESRWKIEDPEFLNRASISQQFASYFEHRIQLTSEKPDIDINLNELDALKLQWLYHLLFADRERAYGLLWDLLDTSWHAYKFDYMNSLLDMAHDVNNILKTTNKKKFDEVLESLENAARAWMTLETFDTERTIELSDKVLNDKAGVRRLKLTALVAKATVLGRKGEYDRPIAMLREAFDGYEGLLEIAKAAEKGDPNAITSLQTEHGISTVHGILPERYLILNTIGVLLRTRGHFDDAQKEFEKSFNLSHKEGNLPWQASATTQIGTVLRYKGDFAQAYDRIHQGLAWRKKAGQRGREAFSINALGMLQRDEGYLDKARVSFNEAFNIWRDLHAEVDMASVLRNLGWIDYLEGKYDLAEEHYLQAQEIFLKKGLTRELPNLRHKQGALWVGKARIAKNDSEHLRFLGKAETLLLDGLKLGDEHNQSLYSALCLIDLCRIAEMRGDYKRIPQWEKRLRKYEREGYHFEPAYADLEAILGKISERKAARDEKINYTLFDDATDHYCQMFVYLARYSSIRYRPRREFLREWLPSLPDELRHRACKRLIECWESHPDLAANHRGFIATVQSMDEL